MSKEGLESFNVLTKSILSSGQRVPIAIDSDNNVIDGVLRVMACINLEIPVKAIVIPPKIKSPIEDYIKL